MATFRKYDDPLMTCPYNPAHRVASSRYQIHITKCRKNYVEVKKTACPFNAKHLLSPEDLPDHLMNCPDRSAVDRHIIRKDGDASRVHGNLSVPISNVETPATGECWDNELTDGSTPSYDLPTCAQPIFRSVTGMKPAERRQHYKSLFSASWDHIPSMNSSKELPKPEEKAGAVLKEFRQPISEPRKEKEQPPLLGTSDQNGRKVSVGKGRLTVAEMLKQGLGRGRPQGSTTQPVAPQGVGIGRSRTLEQRSVAPDSLAPLYSGEVQDVEKREP